MGRTKVDINKQKKSISVAVEPEILEYIKLCSQRYLGNVSLRLARILCGGRTLSLPCYVAILFAENV